MKNTLRICAWMLAILGSSEKVQSRGYTPHIRPHGEEKEELERNLDFRACHWLVEVTHSFFNRFRKLLVRYEKKVASIFLRRLADFPFVLVALIRKKCAVVL